VSRGARGLLAAAAAALASLAAPSGAAAGFHPPRTVAGPSAGVVELGGVSLARDGTGAVAFLRRDGGVPHVFVSRLVGRHPRAPVRVDGGQAGAASAVRVAVADRGMTVVTWLSGGVVYGAVAQSQGAGFDAPRLLCACGPVSSPSLDVSRFGTAYLTFTAPGGGGHDVRAATYDGGAWTLIGTPIDVHGGDDAGGARVAASSDGTGIAAFTERAGGVARVYERRLLLTRLSQAPRRASLGSLSGRRGGAADTAAVDIQDDSSYAWVTFRQDFVDGGRRRSRVIAHRLAGSSFDMTAQVDGLRFPGGGATGAAIALSGRGYGLALTASSSHRLMGAALTRHRDPLQPTFEPPVRLQTAQSAAPLAVASADDHRRGIAAWQRGHGDKRRIVARVFDGYRFSPATTISEPGAGPAPADLGLDSEADDDGNHVIAFVQGKPGARRILVVAYTPR
jgi:hypothetical protein